MKMKYYVSTLEQSNGDHEVHVVTCLWLPKAENRQDLGEFNSCDDAVGKAKTYFSQVNGCFYCSNLCHTQ
jgi:hypothetical protein